MKFHELEKVLRCDYRIVEDNEWGNILHNTWGLHGLTNRVFQSEVVRVENDLEAECIEIRVRLDVD